MGKDYDHCLAASLYRHNAEALSSTACSFPALISVTCRNENNSCLGALLQTGNNKS